MLELQAEVRGLIRETEGYEDALHYVEEIADDLGIEVGLVVAELRRQLGLDGKAGGKKE